MESDRSFVRVVAIGVGLIAFMVTWLILGRLTELLVDQPLAAIAAMSMATVGGIAATFIMGRKLGRPHAEL